MKIIIDTNFILTCVKQKIDLFEELENLFPGSEMIIPEKAIEELVKLTESEKLKGSEKDAACLALKIIEKENLNFLQQEGKVDDIIVDYAIKNKAAIVASLDRGIKKRIANSQFLTIRDRRRIDLA